MPDILGYGDRRADDPNYIRDDHFGNAIFKKESKKKLKRTPPLGKNPFGYRSNPLRTMNQRAYLNEYTLQTEDWFESGTHFAYSLHKTRELAIPINLVLGGFKTMFRNPPMFLE